MEYEIRRTKIISCSLGSKVRKIFKFISVLIIVMFLCQPFDFAQDSSKGGELVEPQLAWGEGGNLRPMAVGEKTQRATLPSGRPVILLPEHTICFEVHNYLEYGGHINALRKEVCEFARYVVLAFSSIRYRSDRLLNIPGLPAYYVIESDGGGMLEEKQLNRHCCEYDSWRKLAENKHIDIIITGNLYGLCIANMFDDLVTLLHKWGISFTCHFIGDEIGVSKYPRSTTAAEKFDSFTPENVYSVDNGYNELSICLKKGFHTWAYLDGEEIFDKKYISTDLKAYIYYWTSTEKFKAQVLGPPRAAEVDIASKERLSQIENGI
jgi:hypothetical protein